MDAITMLKQDHQAVERLFKRFEKAGDRAFAEKRKLADQIVEALSRHAAIEEQVFYPVARATVPGTEDVVLESLEEHHVVKWVLSELDGMDSAAERFDAKMTVLIENVRHHVEEEEHEFFPKVRAELDRKMLAELGRALEAAKELAPTHPHPRSPDTPPGNLAAGGVGMVDRISDTVSGVAQGSVTAVQDLVALILGRRKRSAAPTGSKAARDTAQDVRSGASKLTDDAVAAAVRAKATASSATAGAKKTATTAVDATKDTARVAKKGAKRTAATARRSAKRTASTPKRSSASRPPSARPGAKKAASATRRTAKKATSTTS
jgi:hemerythrin-like domain-containing protein